MLRLRFLEEEEDDDAVVIGAVEVRERLRNVREGGGGVSFAVLETARVADCDGDVVSW